jgi:glycine/D-amino acid oxidase-like deaminating enzyme
LAMGMGFSVAVVGAGIAGLAAAWGLAKTGHPVTVYEKERVGGGASGKALGLLVPFHPNVRGRMAKEQRESVSVWPSMAKEIAEAADVRMEEFFRLWPGVGAQVRVPMILEVMAKALRARGVTFVTLEIKDPQDLLEKHDAVVMAAGLGNAGLMEILPMAGQAVMVKPEVRLERPLQQEGFYIVPTWEGNVLVGSHNHDGPRERHEARITASLVGRAVGMAPELMGCRIVDAWVANRPTSKPLLPLVRPLAPKVWGVTGLGKLGFCFGPAVAKAAEAAL